MRILTRQLIVSKTREEITRILKGSAYYFPEAKFEMSDFSMYCAKRYNGGQLSLTHVKGTISEMEGGCRVILAVHAGLGVFIGGAVILLGVIGLFYCMIFHIHHYLPSLGVILLGLLMGGQPLWEGKALLDRLERKLKTIDG